MRQRHFKSDFRKEDFRPSDGKPCRKGDCTTRAMAYCLRDLFSYRDIEAEQYRRAEEYNKSRACVCRLRRNSRGIWDGIMCDHGYQWMYFGRKVRRDILASILKPCTHPVITLSSHHVAVVHGGLVIDSWDSRHGRCDAILLHIEDLLSVVMLISKFGITLRKGGTTCLTR